MHRFCSYNLWKRYLDIPRYVDTFEPEEPIDVAQAIADLHQALMIISVPLICECSHWLPPHKEPS